jgi:hypothetical protein
MGLGSYSVNMETPLGTPLAYAIENVRSWLDIRQIEPIDLKSQILGIPSSSKLNSRPVMRFAFSNAISGRGQTFIHV